MLPQMPAIPLQSTSSNSDSAQNVNRLLPVGQNVSATVVAVSRDQVQPEIFKLKLEINNRLIQMGVFQALPVGQKININRQSDGQIQISPQSSQSTNTATSQSATNPTQPQVNQQTTNNVATSKPAPELQLKLVQSEHSAKLPTDGRITAAVISSRPVYPSAAPTAQIPPSNQSATTVSTQQPSSSTTQLNPATNPSTAQSPLVQQPAITSSPASTAQPTVTQNTPTQSKQPAVAVPNTPQSSSNTIQTGQPSAAIPKQTPANPAQSIQTPTPTTPTAPTGSMAPNTNPTQPPLTNVLADKGNPPPQTAQPQPQPQPQTNTSTPTRTGPPTHHLISLALPDGSKIEVQAPRPMAQGTQLQLALNNNTSIQVVRVQEPPLNQNSALDKPAIQEVLRNTLPQQQPTATAFNQLAQVAAVTDTNQTSQISSVVRSMLQLFGVRPGSSEAPSQIRQNVELGGLSTERNLSQGRTASPLDMKAQLQQLQQLSEKLPVEQRERFEQIINGLQSRVTSQQLHSLNQWRELPDGGFERVLQLDLPIKQGENWENLELRLSREGGTNSAGEMISVWRVRLHFDLEEQGGVDAEIRLTDGHEISTLFWCEHKQTAEKLRERSEEFSEKLRMCGFNNSEITWHEGSAPAQTQVIHKQLVDLHT